MTKVVLKSILMGILLATSYFQQQTDYYCESWKKGVREIEEKEFLVNLPIAESRRFKAYIKDKFGEDRYQLTVESIVGNNDCEFYIVSLFEYVTHPKIKSFKYPERDNLLQTKFPESFIGCFTGDVDDLANTIYLNEKKNFLPITTNRTFKVENFYCTIKIIEYSFANSSSCKFNHCTLSVKFSNIL
jgi:hypothetical protein